MLLLYATLLMIFLAIYQLFFRIKKKRHLLMVFTTPPPDKRIIWSNRICRDKYEAIFSHNKFICLLDEFGHNNNLNSSAMVKKLFLLQTMNLGDVSDKVNRKLYQMVSRGCSKDGWSIINPLDI